MEDLFPLRQPPSVSALGEAALSAGGREVSLPAAVLLQAPASFRLDLLDPLDRPVAVLYADGAAVVQYRPRRSAASRLDPFPDGCRGLSPGDWVSYALGAGPPPEERARFRALSFLGRRSFQRLEGGELREEILAGRRDGGGFFPARVIWYCGGDPAMLLEPGYAGPAEGPRTVEIRYPRAGVRVVLALEDVRIEERFAGELLRPLLPEGTRWTTFDLVAEP